MTQTVIAIFDNRNEAQQAVERLVAQGFDRENIDLSSQSSDRNHNDDATGDTFGDRVSRFFTNLFDNDDESGRYSSIAKNGTIVTLHTETSEMASRASEILDECGAIDVDEKSRMDSSLTSSSNLMASRNEPNFGASISPGTPVASIDSLDEDITSDVSSRENFTGDADNRSIPVIEEDVQIGKREVERGGMRVRSRIVERPVEESLRLREEHVTVDRTQVDRPASSADFDTFKEGEIELREKVEVPVVSKDARVVEEINLRKDVREREETVRETARRTEVEVDELDAKDETPPLTSKTTKRNNKF